MPALWNLHHKKDILLIENIQRMFIRHIKDVTPFLKKNSFLREIFFYLNTNKDCGPFLFLNKNRSCLVKLFN